MVELVSFIFFLAQSDLPATPGVLPLSLKRAVEIALAPEGSPKIALAEEAMKQAELHRLETRADLLPDVETAVSDHRETVNLKAYGFNFALPTVNAFSFAIPTLVGPFSVFDARASASQTVFDFSTIRRYQVARAYAATLRADASLATARANVELSQALLDQSRRLKAAGTGTGIEVTRAEVQLTNDQQHLVVAEDDRRRAALNLMRAVGLKLDSNIELTDQLSYKRAEIGDLATALADARKLRAELKAQKEREASARMNYSSVKDERLPSLAADANYGTIGSGMTGIQPTYTYGVSLRVPVFTADGAITGGRKAFRCTGRNRPACAIWNSRWNWT